MNPKQYKDHFDKLRTERKTWDTMFQVLGEYVAMIKQNFEGQPANGEFLIDDVFDSTGAYAAVNSASVLSGMLWQGSARQSIYLEAPDDVAMSTEYAEYYEYITDKICNAFDDPKANFSLAWEEYMLDQVIFGTSGIGVESGEDSLLAFQPYGVKELYIDEGKGGKVSDEFLFFEWTVKRVVAEYGIDNVSEKTRKKHEQGKLLDKVKILVCLTPRSEFKAKRGKYAMPVMSLHMEYENQCHVLREGGYSDLPIKVGRFRKLNYERYGRSNGMFALPDIKEANILSEAVIVATEKTLDMPKGVFNDGVLGGGVIDTSANSITVFNPVVGQSGAPIFDIGNPPDVRWALDRLERLKETIGQHFFIDRLLDFNNDTEMTFGEAQIRAQRSNASLASLFSRQISECLSPVIDRAVNILFQVGELGVIEGSEQHLERQQEGKEYKLIPKELVKRLDAGQDIYQIGYRTQASKAYRSEEYIAIVDVAGFAIQAMQIDPNIRHRLDLHQSVKEMASIRGLPVGIIKEDDEVEASIKAEAEAQEGQMALEQAQVGAGIVDTLASANKAARE